MAATIILERSCIVATSRSSKALGDEESTSKTPKEPTPVVAKRRYQNGTDAQAAAAGEIDARVAFGVVAKHDFAGAYGFGRDAGVGLQADTKIRGSAASAGATDDFIPGTQGNRGSGSSSEMLGAFGDGADGGLEVQLGGMDIDFFSRVDGAETGNGMRGVGNAELATKSNRRYASVMLGDVDDLRVGHSAQQVADQAVELRIGDEMSRLHVAQRPAEHAGKAKQGCVSAGEAIRSAIGADQFALDAERQRSAEERNQHL